MIPGKLQRWSNSENFQPYSLNVQAPNRWGPKGFGEGGPGRPPTQILSLWRHHSGEKGI